MLTIVTIFPELLGTYGDGGNALVLSSRAQRRGLRVEQRDIHFGDDLGRADIYLLGGGEDGPQRQATEALARERALSARLDDGAVVFAVCAGLQILGESFAVAGGHDAEGLGIISASTVRGKKRRVGELLIDAGAHRLVGFENHGGETQLNGARPMGTVLKGFGNDGSVDGVREARVLGTYAHGPALALNPWLADTILSAALDRELDPLDTMADRLHRERCAAVAQAGSRRP